MDWYPEEEYTKIANRKKEQFQKYRTKKYSQYISEHCKQTVSSLFEKFQTFKDKFAELKRGFLLG